MGKKKLQRRLDELAKQVSRQDGWQSTFGGWGQHGQDKTQGHYFFADPTNYIECQELWRGDDIGARIVETIPNEMLRQGFEIMLEGDVPNAKDRQMDIASKWEDLGLSGALWQALCYERAYGGAAILLGVNDGQELNQPLNLKQVTAFEWLTVLEPVELQAVTWQTDPRQKDFGLAATYRLNPVSPGGAQLYGTEIHNSRVVIFPGIRVSRRQVSTMAGWGDAVLARCRAILRDFQTAWKAAGVLVNDFSQAVYKIKGLAEIIALDKDEVLRNRVRALELTRSVINAAVLDADGEEFERKTTQISGLPELLDRFATRLSAAADIPVTLLMGQSPAGLNATGDSDMRGFYDRVKALQDRRLKPAVEQIARVIMSALKIDEPDSWRIQFNPLWQPTDLEVAQTRQAQQQTDVGYIGQSVITSEEVRRSRFGGATYSLETQIDGALTAPTTLGPPLGPDGFPAAADQAPATQRGGVPVTGVQAGVDQNTQPKPAIGTQIERPTTDDADIRMDTIIKRDGKWWVRDERNTHDLGGPYDDQGEAVKRLAEIEYFKNKG